MEKALILCSVVSMVKQFNMKNIELLQKNGFEVHVISNFESPGTIPKEDSLKFKEELQKDGVTYYDVSIQRNPFNIANMKALSEIKKIISENNYKIVHCQSPVGGVLARLAARKNRKKGTKVIYTAHGFHFFSGASFKNWIMFYPTETLLSRFTDLLITINKEDYNRAQKLHSKEVQYIPGIGVDTKKIENIKLDKNFLYNNFDVSNDDFIITSVGELNDNKNHQTVIKALASLDIPFKYIICGVGDKKASLIKLVDDLDMTSKVIFAGYRNDVINIIKSSDLFIFPSKREGLPVSLMEAMACGKPVICSEIRGNVDLIIDQQGGYLIKNNTPQEYSKKILELYSNKSIQKSFSEFNLNEIKKYDVTIVDDIMSTIYSKI